MPTATEKDFSEQGFWDKLKNFAVKAGSEVVEKALCLYYAAQQPSTPAWAKTVIYGALAYFILPFNAIPNFIPIAGYTDNLGALATATVFSMARASAELIFWQKEVIPRFTC